MVEISSESPLFRVIDNVVPWDKNLLLDLLWWQPLRIKFGTDPTWKQLHLGHAVNLQLLKAFQDMWHKVDLVIGDATATIGDPTWQNKERPELDVWQINENADLFLSQIQWILSMDENVFQVHRNSVRYTSMNGLEFIWNLLRPMTVNQLLDRSSFKSRMEKDQPIYMHELVYQILQWYDSVHLETNIAVCGNDQLTNELMWRNLQSQYWLPQQVITTTVLTPWIDWKAKQSKSLGNYIWLDHSPEEQFRRIMSIPDDLIKQYFDVYTDLLTSEINDYMRIYANRPRTLKMKLAECMLIRYHAKDLINQASASYENSANWLCPVDSPEFMVNGNEIDVMEFLMQHTSLTSKTQIKSLLFGWGISFDGKKLWESDYNAWRILVQVANNGEWVIKYGKNKWVKVKVKPE